MSVQSSIYYVFDNKYYNAFNTEDINILLSKMKEGYYGVYDKKIDGTPGQIRQIFGDREEFHRKNKRELFNDFQNSYYRELIDYDKSHHLIFKLNDRVTAKVNGIAYKSGDTVDIDLGPDATINNVPDFYQDLVNPRK